MSLEGKTALVTGATGTVGNGILFQLLREGATVIAPVRGSKDALLASLDGANVSNLDVVVADVSDEPSVVELAKHIKDKYGSIDHVITSVGGWWQKGQQQAACKHLATLILARVWGWCSQEPCRP